MKKLTASTVLLLSLTSVLNAQSVGDYRSAATGNWSAIASWERYNGSAWVVAATAPISTDGVISIRNTHTITINAGVTADQIVVDAGGILSLASTLNLNDGTGTDLMVNGDMQMSSGTLSGAGTTVIAPTGTLTLNTNGGKTFNTSLTNNGAFTWNDGNVGGTGAITNNGTMTINGNNSLTNSSAFTNTGTLTKQTGTGTTTIFTSSWSNSGTININSGTLRNLVAFTNTGPINFNTGTWQNDGAFNHSTGSVLSGTGSFINTTTLTLNISLVFPASLVFSNTATITGAGNLTINNPFTIQGSISGAGSFTINADITWMSGTLSRPLTIAAAQTITLNTNGVKTMNAVLLILQNGTLVWNDGTISGSGSITNNGTMTINGDNTISSATTFTNTGTMTKQTGTGTTSIFTTTWSNSGTININSGVLRSLVGNSTGFTNTGSINLNNGTLQNDGILNYNTGSVISGTGNFNNTSTMHLNVSLVFPASLAFSNTSNIDGAGDLTINNAFTVQGNINGAGALTINGAMTWVIGTVGRVLTVTAGSTLTLNTNGTKFMNNTLTIDVNGTMIWNDGTVSGTANIFNNGTIIMNGDNTLSIANGFTNTGTLTKQTGTGTTSIFPLSWSNSGTINVNSGTLRSSAFFTNTGTINFNNGAWQNEAVFNQNAGSIGGSGSFNNANTLTLNVSQVFPASLIFSSTNTINGPGNLTINNAFTIQGTITGTGSLTINANITWVGGTLARALTIVSGQVLTLNTGSGKFMNAALTINANGVLTWNDGTVSGSGTIINNGTMTANGDNSWTTTSTFTNNGTLTKQTGVGSTTITATSWSNSGTININSGTLVSSSTFTNTATGIIKGIGILSFSVTPTNNGTIAPGLSVGILTVNGSNPFGANSTLSIEVAGNGGAGQPTGHDQMLRAGNLTLNGTLIAVETGTVPDGDYIIISLTTGTVTGTFATTNLPASYSVIYNSTNVILRKGSGSACPASVSIAANPGNTICSGTNVTFTATPTNGGTPSYQWKLNNNNVGTNSNTYSNNALVNGDVVSVVMTSSLGCANPNTIASNNIIMAVTVPVTPLVTIVANTGSSICSGTNVVFSATPNNGGTPSYQWKLNGNNVGTNSNTYSNNALVNGDVVTVVMTSSLTCITATTATSSGITMIVTGSVAPSVSISANPGNTICSGTNVTFTATPTNGGTPSYQWKLNGNNVGTNSNTYSNNALVNGDVITVVMTSSLACANPTTATSTGITMIVTGSIAPSVSISANPGNTICSGTNVTFTAAPTNGGTPSYQWKLNGNNVGANSNTYSNNALVNGDIVTVVMTSSLACVSPTTATSSGITMAVTATVAPSVSIGANPGSTICTGTNVTFTATPTNGGTPSYQWKLNGNNVGTNSNTYSNNALANGDVITVVMTSSLACANPTTATSTGITMIITGSVAPSVSISANPGNTICSGTNVTFTATPTNGGTPSYQWKLNGNNVGTNSNTYSNNALINGDVITVVMTSSLACANPTTATSIGITMIITGSVAPSVSISGNPGNTICAGTNVTFTATPTNGGTPSYQWKLNGNNVGTNSNTYSNNALVHGDVITVVMTASLACANPTTATSTGITMIITGSVAPSVSISANPGNTICSGTNVTFTATPTNGGTPSYQWKLNGNNVGTNSNTYSNNALVNGDVITVVMTSSLACANPTTATSTGITMIVTGSVAPSVSISANPGNTICSGTNVTFTATPTNGGTPTYQWKLNGNNVGTNSNTYSNNALVNGDVITVVMTSSLACANPTTATSTGITMIITGSVAPSVSISANPGNTICSGTNVTFTATPTNGGTPTYQWKLNGNNVGINSNTYSNNALANGDVVTVVITSSLGCANPTTATSNAITMTVNPNASAGIVSGVSPLCIGQISTYTSNGASGGSWSSSNTSIATVNSSTGVVTALSAGTTNIVYTVTGSCNTVSASKMLTVNPNASAGVVSGATPLSVGATAIYTSTGTSGGNWSSTNNGIATVNASTGSVAAIGPGTTNITYTVSSGCGSPVSAFQTLTVTNSGGIVYCGPKNTKILICHNGQEICVAPEAVPAHLAHGDIQGHCPTLKTIVTGENEPEKKLIVTAYPNPYETVFKLNIYSPQSGVATIDFYTISGVKIYEMKQNVIAGKSIVTDVKSLSLFTTSIIYKVSVEKYQTTGIIFRPE